MIILVTFLIPIKYLTETIIEKKGLFGLTVCGDKIHHGGKGMAVRVSLVAEE